MVTRSAIALMGMLAVSLTLTGCRNCCSWSCKDGQCDATKQARKLPPVCDGVSCSHQGHTPTPTPKPTPPPAQANTWYNLPAQPQVNTPAASNMRIPQTPVNPAPIAISQPANPATVGNTIRTTANPTGSPAPGGNEAASAVTPVSGTQPVPLRTWPGAESESAAESRPLPERTGMDMDTPAAGPAPMATSPSNTTPMPARPAMLPPATEPTLPPMETSTPANPMMPAQPMQVETQYHEVPSSTRTPMELPPAVPELPVSAPSVAPELPPVSTDKYGSPAPASDNPLMLPPAEGP